MKLQTFFNIDKFNVLQMAEFMHNIESLLETYIMHIQLVYANLFWIATIANQ